MPANTRLSVVRGEHHVSFSQVSTYLMCSERFRLKYVKGLAPSHRPGEMVFGSAIHGAVAFLNEHLRVQGEAPPVEAVQQQFLELLAAEVAGPIPVMWADDDTLATLEERGKAMLALYLESIKGTTVLAAEKPFRVEAAHLPRAFRIEPALVGVVDVIERDPDGSVYITEVKTAARKFDDVRLRYDLQLGVYAAVREELGIPQAKLRFRVLLKTRQPRIDTHVVRRDLADITEAGRIVSQVLRAIEQRIFFPQRGWACSSCPYRSVCGE